MPTDSAVSTATPWATMEIISERLFALVDRGTYTGPVVINFRDGVPCVVEAKSHHGPKDGFRFPIGPEPDS